MLIGGWRSFRALDWLKHIMQATVESGQEVGGCIYSVHLKRVLDFIPFDGISPSACRCILLMR